ncbi:hypothetical protein [Neisseria sp. HMSC064E01]|uniref:hypothetical protein n=1 Tax=Neisseria sp. HMSC064E01 TaxID=1715052 RepID=UPI0008A113F3|nr:hypothetical protein [Neisseria sp. HMSC064E01]OFN89367.1 hypothetical protein HMPREF2572_10825 [Neisseria sp. HMSC064E01]
MGSNHEPAPTSKGRLKSDRSVGFAHKKHQQTRSSETKIPFSDDLRNKPQTQASARNSHNKKPSEIPSQVFRRP